MSDVITTRDLAELYECLGKPGAVHLRELAEAERNDLIRPWTDADEAMQDVWGVLVKIGPTKAAKHDADCWKRHHGCLAAYLRKVIEEGL